MMTVLTMIICSLIRRRGLIVSFVPYVTSDLMELLRVNNMACVPLSKKWSSVFLTCARNKKYLLKCEGHS